MTGVANTECERGLLIQFFRQMLRIRLLEERVLAEFSRGRLFGTTHAYIGQEANAIGILSAARRTDVVFSNHRCHWHYLAHAGDLRRLAAELMGKATGVCGGKGGSQHLCWNDFYSNGIQGGIVPCAAGMSLAEKLKRTDRIVVVFLGDGTFGEGIVYETFNIAALWELPILFVVENNFYAQTTPVALALAGGFAARFHGFGIQTVEIESTDVLEIYETAIRILEMVRERSVPGALIINTYRFCAHSKGDDIRDPQEVEHKQQSDPLKVHGRRLTDSERETVRMEATAEIEDAFRVADSDPWPDPKADLGVALDR